MKYTDQEIEYIRQTIETMLSDGNGKKEIAKSLGWKDGTRLTYWLKKFNLKSNGYNRKYDPKPGDKFGCWEFMSLCDNPRFWQCKCDCGNIKEIDCYSLFCKNRRARSKGCSECRNRKMTYEQWKGYEKISGGFWSSIKASAISRNLKFTISIEYIWQLYLWQDGKCAISGIEIGFSKTRRSAKEYQTASLDRIDSSKGYIQGNVQWIHKDIQPIKWNYRQDKFLEYIKTIYEYQKSLGNI